MVCRLKVEFGMTWDEIKKTTIRQARMLFNYKEREQARMALERENARHAL